MNIPTAGDVNGSVSQSSGRRRKDKGRGLELYVPPQLRDRKKQNCELPKATKDTEDTIQGLCELEEPQNQFLHMHSITVAIVDILDNSNQPLRLNEENINGENSTNQQDTCLSELLNTEKIAQTEKNCLTSESDPALFKETLFNPSMIIDTSHEHERSNDIEISKRDLDNHKKRERDNGEIRLNTPVMLKIPRKELDTDSGQKSKAHSFKISSWPSCDRRSHGSNINKIQIKYGYDDFVNVSEPFIDSHCHLDFIYNKLNQKDGSLDTWMKYYPAMFPRTFKGCIPNFIEPALFIKGLGSDEMHDPQWISNELKNPYVLGATYGCHPHYSSMFNSKVYDYIKNACINRSSSKLVAIGECGIDLCKSDCLLDDQKVALREQAVLAREFGVPIVIHCRSGKRGDAEQICLGILKDNLERFHNIHRHCYTEDWENAKQWIQQHPNVMFGFTSTIAKWTIGSKQYEVLENMPLDRILLETDAPYFKPAQFYSPAERTTPDNISMPGMAINVAFCLAAAKNIHVDEVLRASRRNTEKMYCLDL